MIKMLGLPNDAWELVLVSVLSERKKKLQEYHKAAEEKNDHLREWKYEEFRLLEIISNEVSDLINERENEAWA